MAAKSEGVNGGSELVMRLPALAKAPPRAAPSAGPPEVAPDSRLKVMVVDDNVDAAQILAQLVSRWGHLVRIAHDGAAALETARALEPDVVLLDLELPILDGFEVARRLREREAGARVMIVAVTGFGQRQHIERVRHAGFDHHFVKPVDIPALRSLLRERVMLAAARAG